MNAAALLSWYDRNRRDLPWRRTKDPYAIWLSEIMLQQTRVETVISYWNRFLATWPRVHDLADAKLDDVLAAWAGLGYYARARNLHAAAKKIRDEHGGIFPRDAESVRALPGVGRYTAGAILSIAFDQPEPLVDGNVVRVFARLGAMRGHAKDRALHERCWTLAAKAVPRSRPGDFNQALMELGATVCTPSSPTCGQCPFAKSCKARAKGRQDSIPGTPPRAKRPHRVVEAAFVERAGAILLERRADEGLLGGLWELPSAYRDEGGIGVIAKRLGLRVGDRVARIEHAFSHFDMTLEAFACEAGTKTRGEFVAREKLSSYGMGAATKRAITEAAQPSLFSRPRTRRPRSRSASRDR